MPESSLPYEIALETAKKVGVVFGSEDLVEQLKDLAEVVGEVPRPGQERPAASPR